MAATLQSGPAPDAIIIRVYAAELAKGKRGAKSRTAKLCNCSHTHVTDVLREAGVEQRTPEPLIFPVGKVPEYGVDKVPEYEPCPGEIEARETHAKIAAELKQTPETPVIMSTEPPRSETPDESEPVAPPTPAVFPSGPFQTVHAQEEVFAPVPVSNAIRDDAEWMFCLVLSVAMIVLAGIILTAAKSLLLAVLLMGPWLGIVRIVSQAAQEVRRWRLIE